MSNHSDLIEGNELDRINELCIFILCIPCDELDIIGSPGNIYNMHTLNEKMPDFTLMV